MARPALMASSTVAEPTTREVLRHLELAITMKLDGLLQGDYLGLVPGHGSEPGETRRYTPGDDVRRIDWNVTARMQEPYVRQSIADRELESRLLIDLSPSLDFGTGWCEKRDLVRNAVGAVAFLTNKVGNRIGATILHNGTAHRLPARQGRSHIMALLHKVEDAERVDVAPTNSITLEQGLRQLQVNSRRAGLMVVVSDFLDESDWPGQLRRLSIRHEVLAIEVIDPREMELPNVGLVTMVDPETGRRRDVNTGSRQVREAFAAAADEQRRISASKIKASGANHLVLRTDRDWLMDLVRFVDLQRRRAQATQAVRS